VLDRVNGQFLFGTPFAKLTWASGLDAAGHPMRLANIDPTPEGTYIWPGVQGATPLAETRGRVSGPTGAAAKLRIPPSTLETRIKALKINKQRFKFG
jgi:hypothetical protein